MAKDLIKLRFPTADDLEQIDIACNAKWAVDYGFVHYWESMLDQDPKKLIEFLPKMDQGLGLPSSDHVACRFMFAFNEKKEIVGRTSIRKKLTDHLMKDGGHIGYAVVPEFRKNGYATQILKQSLIYCKENEIHQDGKVLVTCDDDNIGSIKTIENNGGVLWDKIELDPNRPLKRRYWISL